MLILNLCVLSVRDQVWKIIFQHRVFQKLVNLLRARNRDNKGTKNAEGQTPDRLGRSNAFCGLVANLYSLKTKSSWKDSIR